MYKFFEKHKGFMTRFLCIIIAALLVSNVFMLERASALENENTKCSRTD